MTQAQETLSEDHRRDTENAKSTLHYEPFSESSNYIVSVLDLASDTALSNNLLSPSSTLPRISYFGAYPWREHAFVSIPELIQQAASDLQSRHGAVCIIENISPAYIGLLGPAWNIAPEFFANHARHVDREQFWNTEIAWSWDEDNGIVERNHVHLDGMFEYHDLERGSSLGGLTLDSRPNIFPRDCFEKTPYPIQSNTRISYCRAQPNLYLFLVDAPLAMNNIPKLKPTRARTTLRLRYANNRGGVLLPQLFSQPNYTLFDSLRSVFQHEWHRPLLFDTASGVILSHAMVYILCSSLWETNLLHLDSAIRRISFHDLRDPKDSTNDELHNQREDLDYLRRFVGETLKWYPGTLTGYFSTLSTYNQASSKELNRDPVSDPIQNLHRILGEAGMLQAFLIDTFQLLISSLSVRESKLSIEQAKLSNAQALLGTEQARRSAWLTQLASIYLPLSVVTGIFGMNLKEISESPPRFWWAVVVLVVLVMCTVAIYWTLKEVERVVGRRGREQRKGIEVDREA